MKVLLINPSMNLEKTFGKFGKLLEPMPCIGLAYIAAILEKNEIHVEVIDDFAENLGLEKIISKVKEMKPDIVGISCLTPSASSAMKIAELIKEYDKRIVVVFGNLHATLFADSILKKGLVDIVVCGEGEYTILDVVNTLQNNERLEKVKGIKFRENGEIIKTEQRPLIENLDELPYPSWNLFPYKRYGALPFVNIRKPILGILSSRGCPYQCTFCSPRYLRSYRRRDPKKIVDEIEFLIQHYGAKQIAFMDLIFPLTKEHGMKFCEEMISRNLNKEVVWTTETRVDGVDKELLQKMKEAGCGRLMFGIESGVQGLLNNVKKGFKIEDVRRAVKYAKEVSLATVGFFMLGLPGESKEMSMQTIQFAKELDLDFAKFAITVPFPGSQLFDDLVAKGKLNPDQLSMNDWEKFTTFNPNPDELIYTPEGMTGKELLALQKKANSEFYLRPKVMYNQLFKIRTVGILDMIYGVRALFSS